MGARQFCKPLNFLSKVAKNAKRKAIKANFAPLRENALLSYTRIGQSKLLTMKISTLFDNSLYPYSYESTPHFILDQIIWPFAKS
jgi:hypothetical protein